MCALLPKMQKAAKQPGGAAASAAAAADINNIDSATPQATADVGAALKGEIADLEAKLKRAERNL